MTQPSLRPATAEDAAEIARLATQLGYPCDASQMDARLRAVLADPTRTVLVAAHGAVLAGWVGVEHRTTLESGEKAEIVGFVVDAALRRSGIGRLLLAAAERWAAERGFTRLMVRSNTARLESHPFYEKYGYLRAKSQHVYFKALPGPAR